MVESRDILYLYLRNIAAGLISLPISLIVITVIIVSAVLLLPVIWSVIILWWINGFKQVVNGEVDET